MCRLQFSDAVSTQPLAHEPAQYDADDCVEALLALAANNEMDFDAADLTAEPLSTFKVRRGRVCQAQMHAWAVCRHALPSNRSTSV